MHPEASSRSRSPRFWPWLCMLAAICAVQAPVSAASVIWQIEDGASTVIVEGDRALALRTMMRVRQMDAAARWMLGGEDSFKARRALIFVVQPATLRRVFTQNVVANAPINDPESVMGASAALPTLSLVVAPFGPERKFEFTLLQGFLGDLVPTFEGKLQGWPPCMKQGIGSMLSFATFEETNHLLIDAKHFATYSVIVPRNGMTDPVIREYRILNPAEFLDPTTPVPASERDIEDHSFACISLAHWYVTSDGERRRV